MPRPGGLPDEKEVRAGTGTQQDRARGAARRITNHAREGIAHDHTDADRHAADGGWGEDWSEDVERTYQAPPPAGLTEFDLSLYRRLVRYYSRAGSIPSQETLAEEMGLKAKHRVRTVKRSIARLRAAGWLETSRRPQRNARRGGELLGGNRYRPKQSLNDLPEEAFPQMATRGQTIPAGRNEGTQRKAAKPQVATRGQPASSPLVGVEERRDEPRSQRGDTGSESPASTPTVSESKPVEERVSSQPSAQPLSPPSGPPFRTMAEETAWVAARRRAGHAERPPPPDARWSKQRELDEEVRRVVLDAWRGADVVAVVDGPPPVPGPVPVPARPRGPVRYGRLRLDAGLRDFHRAVDRLAWDTCTEGASCGRGEPCPRHQQRRREAS